MSSILRFFVLLILFFISQQGLADSPPLQWAPAAERWHPGAPEVRWAPLEEYQAIERDFFLLQFDHARSQLNKVKSEYPHDPSPIFFESSLMGWECQITQCSPEKRMRILTLLEEGVELVQTLHKSYKSDPRLLTLSGYLYMRLANVYGDIHQWFKSVRAAKRGRYYLEQAIWKDNKEDSPYLPLGAFYYFADNLPWYGKSVGFFLGLNGDRQKGLEMMKRTASSSGVFQNDALFFLSVIYLSFEKEYNEAWKYNEELRKRFPKHPQFLLDQAFLSFKLGRREMALRLYDELILYCHTQKEMPCHPHYLFRSWLGLGEIEMERGEWQKALNLFEKATPYRKITFYEPVARWQYLRGECYRHLGRDSEALKAYEEALVLEEYIPSQAELIHYHIEKWRSKN